MGISMWLIREPSLGLRPVVRGRGGWLRVWQEFRGHERRSDHGPSRHRRHQERCRRGSGRHGPSSGFVRRRRGAGTFAALERDSNFAACIIPESSSFKLCCAHAGALTFVGIVPGVSAHAALRLEGISAIDRYIPIHGALQEYDSSTM